MAPRFVADCMVGRLAKWLRAFGFDVIYHPFAEDSHLLEWARQRGAILLTRDTRLPRPPGVKVILIEQDRVEDQVRQVVLEAPIDLSKADPLSRCTVCNEPLVAVEKEAVRDRLPPHVCATQEVFARCPGCGRLYWQGTHAGRIRERLARLAESLPACRSSSRGPG